MKTRTHTQGLACLLALTLAACAAFLSGCASTGGSDTDTPPVSPAAFEFVTKAATSELLAGDTDLAAEVEAATALGIEAIETGRITTPAAFRDVAANLIDQIDTSPQRKANLLNLYDFLQANYLARIDTGELLPGDTASIVQILTWVNQAAIDTQRFGTVNTYGIDPLPGDVAETYGISDAGSTFLAKIIAFLLFEWLSSDDDDDEPTAYSAPPAATTDAFGFANEGRTLWRKFIDYQLPPDEIDLSLYGYVTSAETRE